MSRKLNKIFVTTIRTPIDNIVNRLEQLELPYEVDYEILQGVVGRDTDIEYKEYDGWGMEYNEDEPQTDWWSRPMTDGEVGCALSHYKMMKQAYDEGHEWVMFLEEDFFAQRSLSDLDLNTFGGDVDGFYLGRFRVEGYGEDEVPYNECWLTPTFSFNTHAYCLHRRAIETIINGDFINNLIPFDGCFASTQANHLRDDVAELFPPYLNIIACDPDYIDQMSEEDDSMTEDLQGNYFNKILNENEDGV